MARRFGSTRPPGMKSSWGAASHRAAASMVPVVRVPAHAGYGDELAELADVVAVALHGSKISSPAAVPCRRAPAAVARGRQEEGTATVDGDDLAGDPARTLRGEELHAVGDVLGLAQPPQRDAGHQVTLAVLAVAGPLPLGGRVGQDEAGTDAVHRDAEGPQLVGHLPGEAELARLGAGVGLDAGLAHGQRGRRRDVDDPAPAALLHARHHGPGAQERAGQVGVDHGMPVLARRPPRAAGRPGRRPRRLVVDQDVHVAAGRGGKNARTWSALVRSASCLSTPVTMAPSARRAATMAAPMPCAVPVTTAVCSRPARPPAGGRSVLLDDFAARGGPCTVVIGVPIACSAACSARYSARYSRKRYTIGRYCGTIPSTRRFRRKSGGAGSPADRPQWLHSQAGPGPDREVSGGQLAGNGRLR